MYNKTSARRNDGRMFSESESTLKANLRRWILVVATAAVPEDIVERSVPEHAVSECDKERPAAAGEYARIENVAV